MEEPNFFVDKKTEHGTTLKEEMENKAAWSGFGINGGPINYYQSKSYDEKQFSENYDQYYFEDSQSGENLFIVPGWNGYRTIKEFWEESVERGYLSFIEDEIYQVKDLDPLLGPYYVGDIVEEYNNDLFSKFGTFLGKTEYNLWLYFKDFDFANNWNKGHRRYIINLSSVAGRQTDWF